MEAGAKRRKVLRALPADGRLSGNHKSHLPDAAEEHWGEKEKSLRFANPAFDAAVENSGQAFVERY